jgi:DNA polymerase IV
VAARLRAAGLAGRTVQVKVRYPDFRTTSRSTTLDGAVDGTAPLLRAARRLLAGVDTAAGVRLLGVGVASLGPHRGEQLSFDSVAVERSPTDPAVDAVRRRFGTDAIGPASLVGDRGLRRKRPGDQQWGPGTLAT